MRLGYFKDLLCFVPYLVVYLVGWKLKVDVVHLSLAFWALHGIHLLLLAPALWRSTSPLPWPRIAFFAALFILFGICGGYFEYPADPWEHFRRTFSFDGVASVGQSDSRFKFPYFWNWALVHGVPPLHRMLALDWLGAAWMILVALQVHRLARRLGFEGRWADLQVVALFALFGTDVFGFRYYAQSSTPLALAGYLALVCRGIDFMDGRIHAKQLGLLTLSLAPMLAFSHAQEVLFAAICAAALWVGSLVTSGFGAASSRGRRRVLLIGSAILLVSIGIGWCIWRYARESAYGGSHTLPLWFGGGFNLAVGRFGSTYGLHGFLALLAAALWARRSPRIAALTIFPAFLLAYPFTAMLIAQVVRADVVYRVIFAFPTSFAFVFGARELFRRWSIALVAVIAFGLVPAAPNFGRLFFAFYQPPPARTYESLGETAQWLRDHRSFSPQCRIASNDATEFILAAYMGRTLPLDYRRDFLNVPKFLKRIDHALDFSEREKVCAFLVADPARLPAETHSLIGAWTGHWGQGTGNPGTYITYEFTFAMEQLTEFGWSKSSVPPYFFLYEPPKAATSP